MSEPVFLKIYHSGKLVTNKQFLSDQISIGSSADGPSLTLADPSVCFWHALIEKRGGEYHISDLGSPTGTFVNSKPVLELPLKHGDQIQIGDFVIQFFIGVPFARPKTPQSLPPQAEDIKPNQAGPVPKEPVGDVPPVVPSKLEPAGDVPPVVPSKLEPAHIATDISSISHSTPVDENPIPLFSHVPAEEEDTPADPLEAEDSKTSSSAKVPLKDEKSIPTKQDFKTGFFPKRAGSTAPALEKAEEVYDDKEPILHPRSVKKDSNIAKPEPVLKPAEVSALVVESSPKPPKPVLKPAEVSALVVESSPKPPKPVLPNKVKPAVAVEPQPRSADSLPPADTPAPVVTPEPKTSPLSARSSDMSDLTSKSPLHAPHFANTEPPPPTPDLAKTQDVPLKPGFQKATYAPESEIKDLNSYLSLGSGPLVEVVVAWKERVLSVHHFESHKKEITIGSDPKADIHCPNLSGTPLYTLLDIKQTANVFISKGVQVSLKDHKGQHSFDTLTQKGLLTTYGSSQVLPLSQGQLINLTFSSALNVYIRYANRVQKAMATGLFNFNFSEMMGIMMSFFFMSMLVFYVALISPQFLDTKEDLESEDIKTATIEFKKKERVVKLKMANKAQKKRTKLSIPNKSKKPKKTKKVGIKKAGKQGRLGQVAAKPKAKSKKKTVTSARSGRSIRTNKAGAGPRSPRPDPTKVGLLGVFGKKGTKKVLDKAYSGTGELAGLADQATGHAGQKEAWGGEGIGTKFKNEGAGGKGSALIGVSSGIKTKGRGGGAKGYGRGGSLGQRGMVQLSLGTSDWDVAGGVDKNAILRVIRRNKHQLEWCYEYALQKRPNMEGKVLLKWDILNERVRGVKVMSNTTRDSALARCLMSRLKNFRFTGTGLQKGQVGEVRIPFAVTKG